ncbi:MAG: NifB/NifX family molybdenum-iron cluster-binding protein [Candidatus Gygaella obscura]|nr:NifB/NifX family molybdenum-iron cluster-binding protein [Candidatus Gygaella obscura]
MRFAISTDKSEVSAHFGRCPSFTIVDIEEGSVKTRLLVANPGHHPGFIPQFLHEKGVECVITGGMGMNATNLFNQHQIKTVVGVTGSIDDVINAICEGKLASGESLCKPGQGKGYGLDKTVCDHE